MPAKSSPSMLGKVQKSWLRTENMTSLKCLCQKMKSSDRSTAKDCEGMFWIPSKLSDIIGDVQLNKEGKQTHEATRRSVDNMWQAVPQSASLARTNHRFLKQRQAQVTVGTPYFAEKLGPRRQRKLLIKPWFNFLEQWRLPRKHLFHRSSRFAVFLPHLQISLLATCKVEVVKPIHDMLWKCFTLYSELGRRTRKKLKLWAKDTNFLIADERAILGVIRNVASGFVPTKYVNSNCMM